MRLHLHQPHILSLRRQGKDYKEGEAKFPPRVQEALSSRAQARDPTVEALVTQICLCDRQQVAGSLDRGGLGMTFRGYVGNQSTKSAQTGA